MGEKRPRADGSRETLMGAVLLLIFFVLAVIDRPHLRELTPAVQQRLAQAQSRKLAAAAGSKAKATTAAGGEVTPVTDAAAPHRNSESESRDEGAGHIEDDRFTIVMLTYKAPKSLSASLRSFAKHGLLSHPKLKEVIVYFQVFNEASDKQVISSAVGNDVAVPVHAIGSPANLPVAEATIVAVKAATTKFVLYLECDRPIFPGGSGVDGGEEAWCNEVEHRVSTALEFVGSGKASVFRLQLYSWPGMASNSILPLNTYGDDVSSNCAAAPTLTKSECNTAKARKGNVYNTAYCKHFRKFKMAKPQKDLCDAMCFYQWATTLSASEYPNIGDGVVTRHQSEASNETVLCLTSSECNWTNQPTLYERKWFLDSIAAPCEASPGKCKGSPGRMSAVRQEQFFLKHDAHWRAKRYPVCLGKGLFFHQEVDNRE